jgi:hypothetical protein
MRTTSGKRGRKRMGSVSGSGSTFSSWFTFNETLGGIFSASAWRKSVMEWLQQLPDSFTVGVLFGLVLGLASRVAVKFLAYGVALLVVVELLAAAGAL